MQNTMVLTHDSMRLKSNTARVDHRLETAVPPTRARSRRGACDTYYYGRKAGWKGPATRLFPLQRKCAVSIGCGPGRACWAASKAYRMQHPEPVGCGPGGGTARHRIPGEWAAPARWRDPCHAGADMCDTATACSITLCLLHGVVRRHDEPGGQRRDIVKWETQTTGDAETVSGGRSVVRYFYEAV